MAKDGITIKCRERLISLFLVTGGVIIALDVDHAAAVTGGCVSGLPRNFWG
jgi:hypothetical protein